MDNFAKKTKQKRPISEIDGFIPNTGNLNRSDDIRKRFRQNYSPNLSTNIDLGKVSESGDGINSRNNPISYSDDKSTQYNNNISSSINLDNPEDEIVTTSKRRLWFRKKNKYNKGKKKSLGKRMLKYSGITFLVVLIGFGSIIGYGYLKGRQIFRGNGDVAPALQKDVTPATLNGEGDGRVNILLLGKGGPGHEAPDLTDTLLLVSIDPIQNEAALLSVPRDLYVKDSAGNSMKINAIYSSAKQSKLAKSGRSDSEIQAAEDAGLDAIKNTVKNVLGVPVHYYVMVDFTAFKEAVDTVGGVTIDVKEPLYDATMAWLNNGNSLLAAKGVQTFDGNRALMYARSRHGSARGDFDRTERQRQVIMALQQKVLSIGTFSNPFKVVELLNTLGDNVRTDLNGTSELKRLYEIGQKIGNDKFLSVGLADPPNVLVTTDMVDGQSIVKPLAGLYEYEDIQSYVRNSLKDAFLKQEDARVVILNGTSTPGLATSREKELKSYGYNIVKIDNAPTTDYTETVLVDVTNAKPFTLSYLEKRLGVKKTANNIEGLPTADTADFVIILGSNEVPKKTTN